MLKINRLEWASSSKEFSFKLPTRIEMGNGILNKVGELCREICNGNKVFIISDPVIEETGMPGRVRKLLEEKQFYCKLYTQVEPNPKDVDCEAGGEAIKSFGADMIVAVGGGSVLDSAKAIALLQAHGGFLRDYVGKGTVTKKVVPIVAIPTTAGTGSEVTRSAVITDRAKSFKMTIKDLALAPSLAIIDPETTYSLPSGLTASTGMDAFVHALEAYTCRLSNPFVDMLAVKAMKLIYPALARVVKSGDDHEGRYRMMLGSLLAGLAFSHADVAAIHCMAEALGGLYDVPHGVANSIFLPVVTAFNARECPEKYAMAAGVCGLPVKGINDREAAALLVSELTEMATDIGIPRLADLEQVNPVHFPRLAKAALANGSTPSNCCNIGEGDYLELYRKAYAL